MVFSNFLKDIFRPLRTRLLYPHVTFDSGAIADKYCVFGKSVRIHQRSVISSSHIDSYSYIGGNSILKNCSIGKFSSIAPEVRIGLGKHPTNFISTYPGFYSASASGVVKFHHDDKVQEHLPIKIGNDVWIGSRAIILDGVSIGDGAVIATNTVVSKDVAPYAIVGGIPAALIKKRFEDDKIKQLLSFQWWEKDIDFIKENAEMFLIPDRFFQLIKDYDDIR